MVDVLREEIKGPMAWKPADLDHDKSWLIQIEPADLDELDKALVHVKAAGFKVTEFGWGDFPLDRFIDKLNIVTDKLRNGPGIATLRGLPIERYTQEDLEIIYWGMGTHLGLPLGQNRRGEKLTRVEAKPGHIPRLGERAYTSPSALKFHVDAGDVACLLCMRPALSGGQGMIASSLAIHNHILKHRPDLLPPLYQGSRTFLRNEGAKRTDDELSPRPVSIFEYYKGNLSCFFTYNSFLNAEGKPGADVTPLHIEAVKYINDLAHTPEFLYLVDFEPGDIQFLNNHTVIHARADYKDSDDPDKRRLLMRLWIRFNEEDYRVSPERSYMLRWGMDRVRPAMV